MPDVNHALTIRQRIYLVAFPQAHYKLESLPPVY
jgi:hypothetical protein